MTSAIRMLLAERYHLEERIATGGMGVVWRAHDERLNRDVAIKLIRAEYAEDPTFRQRLQREALAIAAIRSPHVVRIHDVCEEPDPSGGFRAFLVMELVEGQPLSTLLRDGPLSVAATADLVRQVASAIAAAHERQIVHRDIKPANIMVDATGRVTVLDFGIAQAADSMALTATDLVLGTVRYLSPEQAIGRGATAASDVYSLGVVAYQCASGTFPSEAASDLPGVLGALVRRMLANSPADRPSAAEVAETLAAEPAPTTVMPVVMAARHRVRDRFVARDLRETRSAPLRSRLLLIPTAVAASLLGLPLAFGGNSAPPHPHPEITRQPTPTTPAPTQPVTHQAHPGPGVGPVHGPQPKAVPPHLPPGQAKKGKPAG